MAATQAAGTKADGATPHTPKQTTKAVALAGTPDLDAQTVAELFDLLDDEQSRWWRAGWSAHERRTQAQEHTRAQQLEALERLREPFPPEMIEKRPQVNCSACASNARNSDHRTCSKHHEARCEVCGSYLTTGHIHLDYIGHAQATDRLLKVDPTWNWEPVAVTAQGTPLTDPHGGLWIRLTVCGMTRLGYGDAKGKQPGTTATKEIIGDAIRNAAMRFGMALDLWSKADLHMEPPHPAEPYLARIRDARVWSSPKYLAGVRKEAEEAGQLDVEVPGGGGATLAQILDEQLDHLAGREEAYAREKARREEERAAASAQVAAEHGVRTQGRTAASTPAGQSGARRPPQNGQRQSQDNERQQTLERVRAKVSGPDWNDLGACRSNLQHAQADGFAGDYMTGPDGNPYTIGDLLAGRIRELERDTGQGQDEYGHGDDHDDGPGQEEE